MPVTENDLIGHNRRLTWLALSQQYAPMNGDIVFQISRSSQSTAIQLATGSSYSHMGIVYLRDGDAFVFEAVQPVKLTPLTDWVARGESFSGKDYDLYFEWSDERIYCSELVWKIFEQGAGLEIGELAVMGDFDLSHPSVKAKLAERFGGNVPLQETVISPSAMFAAPQLQTVYEN